MFRNSFLNKAYKSTSLVSILVAACFHEPLKKGGEGFSGDHEESEGGKRSRASGKNI